MFFSSSGLEDEAHVLEIKGEVFNAVLGMVDITRGTNSYYKLQVLKKDNSKRFALFISCMCVSHLFSISKCRLAVVFELFLNVILMG